MVESLFVWTQLIYYEYSQAHLKRKKVQKLSLKWNRILYKSKEYNNLKQKIIPPRYIRTSVCILKIYIYIYMYIIIPVNNDRYYRLRTGIEN